MINAKIKDRISRGGQIWGAWIALSVGGWGDLNLFVEVVRLGRSVLVSERNSGVCFGQSAEFGKGFHVCL